MYPPQKELLLGGREEFLDSAVCHIRLGFGYQEVGGNLARPLPLSSAEALIFSMEGRCIRLSTLIAEGRCRGEHFGHEPPLSFAIMASLLLSETPFPSGTMAKPVLCCCPGRG